MDWTDYAYPLTLCAKARLALVHATLRIGDRGA
jgi:hypothetical protein